MSGAAGNEAPAPADARPPAPNPPAAPVAPDAADAPKAGADDDADSVAGEEDPGAALDTSVGKQPAPPAAA